MVTKIGRRVREYEGKPIIYGYPYEDLVAWFEEHGEKKFRAGQLWDWLYRKRVTSFEEMTNLSKDLIAKLELNVMGKVLFILKQKYFFSIADS